MTQRKKIPNVVVIGGGTGCYVVLSGLKDYSVNLKAIVTMTDSGGSTGRLRDQLGVLPPGDLRQALVALSDSPEIWRKLFAYRFDAGDMNGHSFGNLFLTALEGIKGSLEEAIEEASELLLVKGEVIPVTYSNCTLCAKYADGSLVEGEARIDEAYTKRPRIQYMYLAPEAEPNPKAIEAIKSADYIIFCPGDLHTSVIPNLLVEGISEALSKSAAKKVFVVNLMTKLGQTDDFRASDYVYEIERYSGCFLDYVIVNNKVPDDETLDWYERSDNVSLVEDDLSDKYVTEAKIIRTDVLGETKFVQNLADRVKRSLIRHDPNKLAEILESTIFSK